MYATSEYIHITFSGQINCIKAALSHLIAWLCLAVKLFCYFFSYIFAQTAKLLSHQFFMKRDMSSMGSGKTMVEFFSAAMVLRVCR